MKTTKPTLHLKPEQAIELIKLLKENVQYKARMNFWKQENLDTPSDHNRRHIKLFMRFIRDNKAKIKQIEGEQA